MNANAPSSSPADSSPTEAPSLRTAGAEKGRYVLSVEATGYGENYQAHLLEQYRLYAELTDKLAERRQTANTFFLTLCTALITTLGIVWPNAAGLMGTVWFVAVSCAGVVLSVLWNRILGSYRTMNAAKYDVLRAMERNLPLRPHAAEWEALDKGKNEKRYRSKTHFETKVPWVFAAMFALIGVIALGLRLSPQ